MKLLEIRRQRGTRRVLNYYINGQYLLTSAPTYVIVRVGDWVHIVAHVFGRWRYKKRRYWKAISHVQSGVRVRHRGA
jgi:hypothetical protein